MTNKADARRLICVLHCCCVNVAVVADNHTVMVVDAYVVDADVDTDAMQSYFVVGVETVVNVVDSCLLPP